jgi:hypothetical protein
MAGYNRGIVATRKLNENNKARLEFTGDTETGFIKGRLSHINKDEKRRLTAADAYDISLRERVEDDIVEKGAGTINRFTGMPEYHKTWNLTHMAEHAKKMKIGDVVDYLNPNPISVYENISGKETGVSTVGELIEDPSKKVVDFEQMGLTPEEDPGLFQGTGVGQKSYDELQAMTPEERAEYMKTEFDIGAGYEQHMTGFQEDPFGFLGEQQALTTKGLESSYGATMGALGSQQATLGLAGEGLMAQQATLGRTTGRGISQATTGARRAAGQANMAFSGTITQGLEAQKKQLFQDYTAGTQDISRQRAGIDIAMGDIGRQRETALETLTLGKEGVGLDFRAAEYAEKKRQEEQFYTDIGTIGGLI